jgi:hypothetical protein
LINDVRDVRGEVPEVRRDSRERSANSLLNKKEENIIYMKPPAQNREPDYLREANLLQKRFRLINSIKAPNENKLDEMMKEYLLNSNSSDFYSQKHKVTDNYWCCWIWKRRL